MGFLRFFVHYWIWHYTEALVDIWNLSRNFLWFLSNLFSISVLLKTLFSPFMRIQEKYQSVLVRPEEFLSTFVANILTRIVGFFVRAVVILVGCIMIILGIAASMLFFLIWLVLPFILLGVLLFGFWLLFNL